jgi:DNA-binding beta-propeller fold protein YncE
VDRSDFLLRVGTASLFLARAPAWARGISRGPLALVTADEEAHVAAVDPRTGRIVQRLRTVAGPRSIERVAGRAAVVAHTTEGKISLLQASPLRVSRLLGGFVEPRYTAARRDGRYAYVTDSKLGEVATVDLEAGRVVHRASLGGPARHVTLDRSSRTLWVALGSKAAFVAVLDVSEPASPRLLRTVRPPFLAHDVGFAPQGGVAWVTSGDRGAIAIYDVRSRRLLHRIAAGAPPQHVTFLAGVAYATSGNDGTFRMHDAASGRLVRARPVPRGSYNVQQAYDLVLTPSLDVGTLCILAASGQLLQQVEVAASSHDACLVLSG